MKLPKESKLREDFASRKVFKKNLCFNLCLKQGRGYKAQSSVSLRKALAIRLNRTFFCRIFLKKISPLNWTWGSLPTKVSSNSPVQLNGLSPLSKSIGWSWWTIFVPFPFQIAWGFPGGNPVPYIGKCSQCHQLHPNLKLLLDQLWQAKKWCFNESAWWFQPTHLKNIRQIGHLPQRIGVNIKKIFETTT